MQNHKRQKISEVMEKGVGDDDAVRTLLELFGNVGRDDNTGNLFIMGADPRPVEMTILDDGAYETDAGRGFH
jgi:hypothetical protein